MYIHVRVYILYVYAYVYAIMSLNLKGYDVPYVYCKFIAFCKIYFELVI